MKQLVSIALISSALVSSAFAAEGYVGLEVGKVSGELSADWFSGKYNADPLVYKAKGGSEINQNFAVEGYIGFGLGDDEVGDTDLDAEVNSMVGVAVKGILPLGDVFSLNGKVGLTSISYEDSDGDKYKGTGLEYGVGMKVGIGSSAAITLDYSVLPDADNDKFDIDVESEILSIGFQYYP